MTTSLIIPSFNGKKHLEINLPTISELEIGEITIIEDASKDGSADYITNNYPKIKLIRHDVNKGFTVSVNEGFTHAKGEIVFLLNQDVKPDKNLIKYTIQHFDDPNVFAVTFNEENRSWAKGEWKDGFFEFSNGTRDNKIHESAWASGGSAAFRKSYWDELGGFDPIFTPGYFEDLDLGLRAHKAGYKILWDPRCKVEHTTETAFKKAFSPKKLQLIKERNYLLANWKNMPNGMWGDHLKSLICRIFDHPGYIIPLSMALWRKLVSL